MRIFALSAGVLFSVNFAEISAQSPKSDINIEKKDLYITGFGPFYDFDKDGELDRNPTQDVIEYFKEQGYRAEVLKVDYKKSTNRLEKIIKRRKPKLIISLGVSSNADFIDLSTAANNEYYTRNLDKIIEKVQKIDEDLGKKMPLDVDDLDYICECWDENKISFYKDENPGYDQCNYLLFRGISLTKDVDTKYFFIHVPYDIYSNRGIFLNLEKAIESLIDN